MTDQKKYDWEKLAATPEFQKLKNKTLTVTIPKESVRGIVVGHTDNLYPVQKNVFVRTKPDQEIKDQSLKYDLKYALGKPQISPMKKHYGITAKELSDKLGFNTQAMVEPTTLKEVSGVLDEAINLVSELNDSIDAELGNFATERFSSKNKSFMQHMDRKDFAHISYLDKDIRSKMITEGRIDLQPWVKLFTIDPSYCYFTNAQNVKIGRIKMVRDNIDLWMFESIEINGTSHTFNCTKRYPYDCEREVVKWMDDNNLLELFRDYK